MRHAACRRPRRPAARAPRRRRAVPDDVADAAIAGAEIHDQYRGDRQGRGDAGRAGHQHAEPAVRAVVISRPVSSAISLRNEITVPGSRPLGLAMGTRTTGSSPHLAGAFEPIPDRNRGTAAIGHRSGDCGSMRSGFRGFIVTGRRGRYSGGSRSRDRGNSNVDSDGFAAGLGSGRSHLRAAVVDGGRAGARWSAARPRSGTSEYVN